MVAIHPSNMKKPGIKTLGKMQYAERQTKQWYQEREAKARQEREEIIAHNERRIRHILAVFARYPHRTGRIDAYEIWNIEGPSYVMMQAPIAIQNAGLTHSSRPYGFIRAVARIFLNCKVEFQQGQQKDWLVFIREKDEQVTPSTPSPAALPLDYDPYTPIKPGADGLIWTEQPVLDAILSTGKSAPSSCPRGWDKV